MYNVAREDLPQLLRAPKSGVAMGEEMKEMKSVEELSVQHGRDSLLVTFHVLGDGKLSTPFLGKVYRGPAPRNFENITTHFIIRSFQYLIESSETLQSQYTSLISLRIYSSPYLLQDGLSLRPHPFHPLLLLCSSPKPAEVVNLNNTQRLIFTQVPAAFILQFLPNAWAMVAAGRNYDLCYPRKMEDTCNKDQSLDKAVRLSETSKISSCRVD